MHPISAFQSAVLEGFEVAENDEDFLVTFGVVPTAPHTGFGYLRRGETLPGHSEVFTVVEFKEKPDRSTAEEYLTSGEYWWNSGMFVWRARTLLDQLKLVLQPKTHDAVVELAVAPSRLSEIYPELLKISVDYAVMEPVARAKGVLALSQCGCRSLGTMSAASRRSASSCRATNTAMPSTASRCWSTRGTTW